MIAKKLLENTATLAINSPCDITNFVVCKRMAMSSYVMVK